MKLTGAKRRTGRQTCRTSGRPVDVAFHGFPSGTAQPGLGINTGPGIFLSIVGGHVSVTFVPRALSSFMFLFLRTGTPLHFATETFS